MNGELEKMTIIAYENENFTGEVEQVTVAVNPEKYTHTYKIYYSKVDAIGSAGGSPKFSNVPSDKVDFELVFDASGVIPNVSNDPVPDQIKKFRNTVFKYDGKIHSPKFLTISWGTLLFDCRLESMKINYTLFKPDGTPLRARTTTSFIGFESETDLAARENKSSPDVSHMVTVIKGDNLPLLCHRVYKDCSLYTEVARVNGLVDFRNPTPGAELLFPPLKS